jgi:hypothetical protein
VLGVPVAAVGAIEGVADGAAALSKTIAGRLADRRPHPPMIAASPGREEHGPPADGILSSGRTHPRPE